MKRNGHKTCRPSRCTLAELVAVVNKLTNNERLTAYIVADMINSHQVSIEGQFQGRRVVVA
jgi:aspartate 1-decarboxylase